jgi:hypothetical protein
VNNQNALDECMLIAPLQKEVESRGNSVYFY